MEGIQTSPLWQHRIQSIPERMKRLLKAFKTKNFQLLGTIIEEDCLDMHQVMQTQNPPLFYWNEETERIMHTIVDWRKHGIPIYFTIDAGPNVHLICENEYAKEVGERIKHIVGVQSVISNCVSKGTYCIEKHLF
jgi:diphosphomevalonate decarboxylase